MSSGNDKEGNRLLWMALTAFVILPFLRWGCNAWTEMQVAAEYETIRHIGSQLLTEAGATLEESVDLNTDYTIRCLAAAERADKAKRPRGPASVFQAEVRLRLEQLREMRRPQQPQASR